MDRNKRNRIKAMKLGQTEQSKRLPRDINATLGSTWYVTSTEGGLLARDSSLPRIMDSSNKETTQPPWNLEWKRAQTTPRACLIGRVINISEQGARHLDSSNTRERADSTVSFLSPHHPAPKSNLDQVLAMRARLSLHCEHNVVGQLRRFLSCRDKTRNTSALIWIQICSVLQWMCKRSPNPTWRLRRPAQGFIGLPVGFKLGPFPLHHFDVPRSKL